MRAHPAELIRIKRDGGELSDEQLRDLVSGVIDGDLGAEQLGALLMAVCCRGMSVRETTTLTLAMRDSGRVLDLSGIPGPKIDKHSTGGVGDKTSLLVAPLVAAAGVAVPMISGRGLGHTGGTIDKLQSIPGYRTDLDPDEFAAVLADCGFVMAGASASIAPADRRMYAARDVTGTVESIPLIVSSILSKKLAEGIDGLVLDVKFGRAAFMRERADAVELMESLVSTGNAAGTAVTALLTDMDRPLGRAIGNSLEVAEVVDALHGRGPADLVELSLALAAEMLVLAGVASNPDQALPRLRALVEDGSARRAFARNVARQGGDAACVEDPAALGIAPVRLDVPSPASGCVADVDPLAIGRAAMALGAGRRQPGDAVDPLVGVVLQRSRSERVRAGQPLATVHARDRGAAEAAAVRVLDAFTIGDREPAPRPLVADRRAAKAVP